MNTAETVIAHIGLGGNMGDVRASLCAALRILHEHPQAGVLRVSHLYRTPPWGKEDQDRFLNACAAVETSLEPAALLELCLDIEKRLGRVRVERWGPRALDLDLLTYGNETVKTETLELPHPRMTERAFVLVPLADIAPELEISGRSVAEWLADLDHGAIERIADADEWWNPDGEGASGLNL